MRIHVIKIVQIRMGLTLVHAKMALYYWMTRGLAKVLDERYCLTLFNSSLQLMQMLMNFKMTTAHECACDDGYEMISGENVCVGQYPS